MEEAKAAGYEFCKCCVTIKGFVRSEYKLIKDYKKKYEIICKIKEEGLEIISHKDRWLVIEKGRPAEFELYHKNKKKPAWTATASTVTSARASGKKPCRSTVTASWRC